MSITKPVILILYASLLAPLPALPAPTTDELTDGGRGRSLLNALGCKGCHSFEGSGGTLGPALDDVGKRLDTAGIKAKLLSPRNHNPKSMMPSYSHLPSPDLKLLAAFLAGQK